jgi:hypothetical protein
MFEERSPGAQRKVGLTSTFRPAPDNLAIVVHLHFFLNRRESWEAFAIYIYIYIYRVWSIDLSYNDVKREKPIYALSLSAFDVIIRRSICRSILISNMHIWSHLHTLLYGKFTWLKKRSVKNKFRKDKTSWEYNIWFKTRRRLRL